MINIASRLKQAIDRLSGPRGPKRHVTVYSREGCTCCEHAMHDLQEVARKYALEIQTVDVDTDPELTAQYGLEVPVIAIDGKVRFRGKVNRILLQRLLASGMQEN
jgi:glutaredoxin